MGDHDIEDDWHPPNDAELKIIEARHERSNRISQLMGSYMLKGYRMLDRLCVTCNTILLQDRSGQDYCVACRELESEISKDDPAVSAEAAAATANEQHQRQNSTSFTVTKATSNPPAEEPKSFICSTKERKDTSSEHNQSVACTTAPLHGSGESAFLLTAYQRIKSRIDFFSEKLCRTESPDETIQLCAAIKACTEAAIATKKLV